MLAVARSPRHGFSKDVVDGIALLAGVGVEGDAHAGAAVQHRSRLRADPTQPNLRQVHLLHGELLDEFGVDPGALGENVTTRGIDLLSLPVGSVLALGEQALVCLTGLRNPCAQIEAFRPGLLRQVVHRDAAGQAVLLAGVMGVVVAGGGVRAGDAVRVALPPGPPRPLERV